MLSLHFLKKIVSKLRILNCVFKKVRKKIRLQGAVHLENNEIVLFMISCRRDFQDDYVLMFAGMFLRVLSLYRAIPK